MIQTGPEIMAGRENLDTETVDLHGFKFTETTSLLRRHLHMQENMLRQIVNFTTTITTNIGIIRETVLLQYVHLYTTRACLTVWECNPISIRI